MLMVLHILSGLPGKVNSSELMVEIRGSMR